MKVVGWLVGWSSGIGRVLAAQACRGRGEVRVQGGERGPGASSWRCLGVSGRLVSHRIAYESRVCVPRESHCR